MQQLLLRPPSDDDDNEEYITICTIKVERRSFFRFHGKRYEWFTKCHCCQQISISRVLLPLALVKLISKFTYLNHQNNKTWIQPMPSRFSTYYFCSPITPSTSESEIDEEESVANK